MARIATANGVTNALVNLVPSRTGRTANLESLYIQNPEAVDALVVLSDSLTAGVIWTQPVPAGGVASTKFCEEGRVSPLVALLSSGAGIKVQTSVAVAGGVNVTAEFGRVSG